MKPIRFHALIRLAHNARFFEAAERGRAKTYGVSLAEWREILGWAP